MLTYSMGVSVDGFVADRDGRFDWTAPDEELFHFALIGGLGAYLLGRRRYEAMLVWETDRSMRDTEVGAAVSDMWIALPKGIFCRTLTSVQGNARLAAGTVAEEIAAARAATDRDLQIGGPTLAGAAFSLGLIDELHIVRHPVVVGGGTPSPPPSPGQCRSRWSRRGRSPHRRSASDTDASGQRRRSARTCQGHLPRVRPTMRRSDPS